MKKRIQRALRAVAWLLALGFALTVCSAPKMQLKPGAGYVAMGSSFAAGPLLGAPREQLDPRCLGSVENYPHQLARLRGFDLTDVSCSGAKTAHILGPWKELAPQIDAVTPETQLITVTVGGNDLGYIGGLIQAACTNAGPNPAFGRGCGTIPAEPDKAAYQGVAERLGEIAAQVATRAPKARLVFVNYASVLPPDSVCPQLALTPAQADQGRAIAKRLAKITAQAADENGAQLVDAAALTQAHHACADEPWMTGYLDAAGQHQRMPYHPTQAGMTAVAEALAGALP
ncbi:MAG: SGNH/GDSL hydrolase family protein [Pseudomonadota bacterium]